MKRSIRRDRWVRMLYALPLALAACSGGVPEEESSSHAATDAQAALSSDCTGLRPDRAGPWLSDASFSEGEEATCGIGPSDGLGHVPVASNNTMSGMTLWKVLGLEAGRGSGYFWYLDRADLLPQHDGFISVDYIWHMGETHLKSWGAGGSLRKDTMLMTSDFVRPVPDFGSGALVAYAAGDGHLVAQRFVSDGTPRSEPAEVAMLSRKPAWIAAGVNADRDTLVLFEGAAAGLEPSHIAGRWLSATGVPRTDVFDLGALSLSAMAGAQAPSLYPLYDGSLVLQWDGAWIMRIAARATKATAVPSWLSARPDMRPVWIRGGRGYGLIPSEGRNVPACYQQIRIHAQDGNYCGTVTLGVDDQPCVTQRLEVGLDGTVIQRSPRTSCEGDPAVCTCTVRWWPGLLR